MIWDLRGMPIVKCNKREAVTGKPGMSEDAIKYILIVEDSPIDYEIVTRALDKAGINVPVKRCVTGDEAIILLQTIMFHDAVSQQVVEISKDGIDDCMPFLVLLDLNLPGVDGRAVLEFIKTNRETAHIPVIIFSTSANERDIDDCYDLGANCYLQKPTSPDDYTSLISALGEFWFKHVIYKQ